MVWVESDDIDGVCNKVGEGVDIIVVQFAVAVVNDIFDTADVDAGLLYDGLDGFYDIGRRGISFYFQAILWCVECAGVADQFHTSICLADVCRAEVEGIAGEVYADGVEEFSTQGLYAGDIAIAGGDELLQQGGMIDAEIEVAFGYGGTEVFGPNMSCAWAPEWNGLGAEEQAQEVEGGGVVVVDQEGVWPHLHSAHVGTGAPPPADRCTAPS